jgi:two-component system nitrogen regulation sensor histidine kinase NtrY
LKVPRLKNIKSLESYSKPLVNTLMRLKTGEKALVKVDDHSELLHFVIYATEFILREHRIKLVSIQNIQSELEEKEMEAWQNLIRVLTHEIMNSVTPIASLASSVNGMLLKASDRRVSEDKIKGQSITDIRSAVQTIQKRSQGLLHFIDSYRTLTHIPKPNFQIFSIASLFDGVEQLMKTQLQEKAVDFTTAIEPETLELTADPELIEQVLINLLLNAILAFENQPNPTIELTACMDERGRIVISVSDNGPGILEEVQDKIFIPFFTTRKNGSGIGLSLSRQVMRMHGGIISVQSRPNEKTVFTLRF